MFHVSRKGFSVVWKQLELTHINSFLLVLVSESRSGVVKECNATELSFGGSNIFEFSIYATYSNVQYFTHKIKSE